MLSAGCKILLEVKLNEVWTQLEHHKQVEQAVTFSKLEFLDFLDLKVFPRVKWATHSLQGIPVITSLPGITVRRVNYSTVSGLATSKCGVQKSHSLGTL